MFLKLVVLPYPDEISALAALDAAQVVCTACRIAPVIAKRDYRLLIDPNVIGLPAYMISDAEISGAYTWEVALEAARHMLRLPPAYPLDLEVLSTRCTEAVKDQHGPDRYTWRRSKSTALHQSTLDLLERIQRDTSL